MLAWEKERFGMEREGLETGNGKDRETIYWERDETGKGKGREYWEREGREKEG